MANEPKVIFQDGRAYFNRADVPDIGHWERNLVGEYHGLSSEKDKAPTYANLPSGTQAVCDDTLEVGLYNRESRTWIWH